MNLKRLAVTDEQKAMHNELRELVNRHRKTLRLEEQTALIAQFLGAMIALFDPSSLTPAQTMEFVLKNIEAGNIDGVAQYNAAMAEQGALQ